MFRTICKFAIRSYSTFKRPPPGHIFKRPVVPSDFEKPTFSESTYDCENEKWTDTAGKEMFKPKYGNSYYEYSNEEVFEEKK
tara:strand:- start:1437 stop:1682 length:246 start_codon:yes stop_codon:yes gene_type:complete